RHRYLVIVLAHAAKQRLTAPLPGLSIQTAAASSDQTAEGEKASLRNPRGIAQSSSHSQLFSLNCVCRTVNARELSKRFSVTLGVRPPASRRAFVCLLLRFWMEGSSLTVETAIHCPDQR